MADTIKPLEVTRVPPQVPREAEMRLERGRGMNLRTLILLRWIAILGQTAAVLTVHFSLEFRLPLIPCLIAISIAIILNLVLMRNRTERARLKDTHAAQILGFDLIQLSVLLFLTGGLENPFSVLILAPVIVSATILSRGATVGLCAMSLAVNTFLAFYHLPLPWVEPGGFVMPLPYVLGMWAGLAVATVFMATYVWSVAEEARRNVQALGVTQAALARAQRMSALGGLAAAAAHQLGSPLATIAVAAKELQKEVPPDSAVAEDAELLVSQAERCRDILAGLAASPDVSGGAPYERLGVSALVEAAAVPHETDEIELDIVVEDGVVGEEPEVHRSPEVLHGLGDLVQNAVQFAKSAVELRVYWDDDVVRVIIKDDGRGFPAWMLTALGEPYISTRSGTGEHMGLGIFIAQTLLERVGASLTFRNDGGAEVVIRWPRDKFMVLAE